MTPMQGLVQYQPLLLSRILEHGGETYPDVQIVSCVDEGVFRYNYRQAAERARRLASSLAHLGVGRGDYVGSLAFTTHRHFELMYAAPGIGAVLHTANPRLSAEHVTYTVNHAGERLLFVDPECIGLVRELLPKLSQVDTIIVMSDRFDVPDLAARRVIFYEDLIENGASDFIWPSFDERTGSTLCFTSGTTGDPKGVLYSHRGTVLSSLVIAAPNAWSVAHRDAIIALAPFFHCNGWGSPYLGPMSGAKLILPGRMLDGRSIQQLIVAEGATVGPAVPTVWMSLVEYCRQARVDLGTLERIICGGAAPPLELMRTLWKEYRVRTIQVWGMTETTHAATVQWSNDEILSGRTEPTAPQGQPVFGSQIRIVTDESEPLPKDGKAVGHLQVKGHWCASAYLKRPDVALNNTEGWLATGDLAAIESNNALRITDRFKDVIKSGGEWISSIDLENTAASHPAVSEAAVIGVPHPKWQERPVMFLTTRQGIEVSAELLRQHLAKTVAKWWLPDEFIFVEELPHNATGKVKKDLLREQHRELVRQRSSG